MRCDYEIVDRVDLALCMMLLANSRLHYRELAERLGLSTNAVHKRIQALIDSGIIRNFNTKISLWAARAVHILVYGESHAKNLDDVADRLSKDDCTYWVALASGNFIYAGAYLKGIGDLDRYVSFVKSAAGIPEPTVFIVTFPSFDGMQSYEDTRLTELDYRIIRSLSKDSRKAVSDVAEDVGISSKTVRGRLERMENKALVHHSIDWFPDADNDIISVFHLDIKPSEDKTKVGEGIMNKYAPSMLFYWQASNLPNTMLCLVCTHTMMELNALRKKIQDEPAFANVVPRILYNGMIFDTWRDKLVEASCKK